MIARDINSLKLASWIIILWGASQAKLFLVPLLLAALLGFLMTPLVTLLRKRKIPEWAALFLAAFLLFLPVMGLVFLIVKEVMILVRDYPILLASLRNYWASLETNPTLRQFEFLDFAYIQEKLSEQAGRGFSFLLESLRALAEASAQLVIVLFFSVIMLAGRFQLRKSAVKLMGHARLLDAITLLIEKFLIARLGIALLVACVDIIILKCMGSRYSVLLGSILGLSTLVPVVGFFLAIIPPIALSLAVGHTFLSTFILVALLYIVSSIESHFITPKYLGRQLNLNLLATFIGLFAGHLIWGMWGMVLSIPILGVTRIILEATDKTRPWASLLAAKDVSPLID